MWFTCRLSWPALSLNILQRCVTSCHQSKTEAWKWKRPRVKRRGNFLSKITEITSNTCPACGPYGYCEKQLPRLSSQAVVNSGVAWTGKDGDLSLVHEHYKAFCTLPLLIWLTHDNNSKWPMQLITSAQIKQNNARGDTSLGWISWRQSSGRLGLSTYTEKMQTPQAGGAPPHLNSETSVANHYTRPVQYRVIHRYLVEARGHHVTSSLLNLSYPRKRV